MTPGDHPYWRLAPIGLGRSPLVRVSLPIAAKCLPAEHWQGAARLHSFSLMRTEEGAHYRLTILPTRTSETRSHRLAPGDRGQREKGTPVLVGGVEFEPQGLEFLARGVADYRPGQAAAGERRSGDVGFEPDGEFLF